MLEFKHRRKPSSPSIVFAVSEQPRSEFPPGRQPPGRTRLRYGVPACAQCRDGVDQVLLDWARERPDLDFSPVGVITRIARARAHLDAELRAVFARFGLTAADFTVIVTLRRSGAPYTMPQARLMDALGQTSGTVSVRLDRLEHSGIVSREPDPASARSSLVRLSDKGLRLFDEVAPAHLANEDRLLSALGPAERQQLADLLRRLLAGFESATTEVAAGLGLTLEPAHLARARRQAVGLSDTPGLLVTDVAPGSAGAKAGIERGDLITAIDGVPTTSGSGLALLLDDLVGRHRVTVTLLRGNDQATAELELAPP
jgi:DNA-binding MarR family transcriptional regulator